MITFGVGPMLLAAASLCSQASTDGRIAVMGLELTGPFDGATLEVAAEGHTRIEGHLLAAESRTLRVPVPFKKSLIASAPSMRSEVRVHLDRDTGDLGVERGRVRFLDRLGAESSDIGALPAGLRARPRPPLAVPEPAPGVATLALLAASFIVGLALRKRPLVSLVFGVASASSFFLLGPQRSSTVPQHVTIEEGDLSSATWLEVEATRGRLQIAGEPSAVHVESLPVDAPIECRVVLESASAWEIAAPRALLYRLTSFDPGVRSFTRSENRWVDLEETWLRDSGAWSARGEWRMGAPLPESRLELHPESRGATGAPESRGAAQSPESPGSMSSSAPPGWLAAGLPQGTSILIGRARTRPGAGLVYFRVSGF